MGGAYSMHKGDEKFIGHLTENFEEKIPLLET
jgi:hypothetical protein